MSAVTSPTFAEAFEAVRKSLHLTQRRVAELHGVSPRTVERWVLRETTPPLHERIKLLRTLRDAPLHLLETLARVSGTTLDAAGIASAPASAPPPPSSLFLSPMSQSIGASAQRVIDDAVRELADELDLTANTIRPGLSRFLGALAVVGAPVDAAARMVLGLPRGNSPGKTSRSGATNGGPRPRN
jgi:transcriptional regulator with XRE-family HTH domain